MINFWDKTMNRCLHASILFLVYVKAHCINFLVLTEEKALKFIYFLESENRSLLYRTGKNRPLKPGIMEVVLWIAEKITGLFLTV